MDDVADGFYLLFLISFVIIVRADILKLRRLVQFKLLQQWAYCTVTIPGNSLICDHQEGQLER
jgi:hypothetical protein